MTTINSFKGEYSFLSNFYPAEVTVQGIDFPTAEHAYQAGKTTDWSRMHFVAAASTPGEAKKLGQSLQLREDWATRKDEWMYIVLFQKFRQHHDLLAQLLATGDTELVEGNTWHDQIWGDCTCPKHADTPGDNQLGHLLMRIREEMKDWKGEPA